MAEPVWQFRLSVGNEPLFSVPVRTQGCQTLPNAHPWASHPIALGFSGTGLEAQSSQTDAVKSLIRWESPHPLSIAGVKRTVPSEIPIRNQKYRSSRPLTRLAHRSEKVCDRPVNGGADLIISGDEDLLEMRSEL